MCHALTVRLHTLSFAPETSDSALHSAFILYKIADRGKNIKDSCICNILIQRRVDFYFILTFTSFNGNQIHSVFLQ